MSGQTPTLHRVASRMADGLASVLFPASCVHCGAIVDREKNGGLQSLCGACAGLVDLVRPPCCTTCGHPFFGVMEGTRECPHCQGLDAAFGEGRVATLFKGPIRSLVLELKYHRGVHVLHDIRQFLTRSEHVCEFARGATLVPVPLHPRKRRERGYNQAELIAAALADAAGPPTVCRRLLRRTIDTETQTAFDRRSRMANLKNAFALARGADINPALRYILVDDVFTTGSTLNRCAHVLRRAGALNLGVVTFGHG